MVQKAMAVEKHLPQEHHGCHRNCHRQQKKAFQKMHAFLFVLSKAPQSSGTAAQVSEYRFQKTQSILGCQPKRLICKNYFEIFKACESSADRTAKERRITSIYGISQNKATPRKLGNIKKSPLTSRCLFFLHLFHILCFTLKDSTVISKFSLKQNLIFRENLETPVI